MKMPESFFSRAVLAYLPFMAYSLDPERAWWAAALIVGIYWLTLTVFWFTRRLFPEGVVKAVFFLWLGLWGQTAWMLFGLLPFWIVSVFLLVPVGFLDESKTASRLPVFSREVSKYLAERFFSGLGFFAFVGIFEFVGEFLGHFGRFATLRGPAGIFLLIFLVSLLWKNQPAAKGSLSAAKGRWTRR